MSFSFGSSAPSTGGFGFSFGNSSGGSSSAFGTQSQAAPATGTGFSFGAPSTGGGFGFGTGTSTTTNTAPSTGFTGFSFGTQQQPQQQQQQQQAAPASTGFGFGTFGTQQQPQQQQQQQQAGFGAQPQPSTSFLSSSTSAASSSIESRLIALQRSYDPSSADCRFQTVFYNKVEPHTVGQYVKPPLANVRLWDAAVSHNPDPATLVPSLAIGFDDLTKRIAQQDKAAAAFNATLATISKSIETMVHGHESATLASLHALQRTHAQQSHRLLQLMNRVELAKARDAGPRVAAEIEFEQKLRSIERKLTQPTPIMQQLQELSERVARMEEEALGGGQSGTAQTSLSALNPTWLSQDEQAQQKLFEILRVQREAIDHIVNVIKQDQCDVNTIQQCTGQAAGNV